MLRITPGAILMLFLGAQWAGVGDVPSGESGPLSREFALEHVEVAVAATVLRTIAQPRQLEFLDGRRLRITATPEDLEVVEGLLRMLDIPSHAEMTFESFDDPAQHSVIARIPLRAASPKQAMTALREILRIRRAAASSKPTWIVLRDTREQIDAAWKLVQLMEDKCSASDCLCTQ